MLSLGLEERWQREKSFNWFQVNKWSFFFFSPEVCCDIFKLLVVTSCISERYRCYKDIELVGHWKEWTKLFTTLWIQHIVSIVFENVSQITSNLIAICDSENSSVLRLSIHMRNKYFYKVCMFFTKNVSFLVPRPVYCLLLPSRDGSLCTSTCTVPWGMDMWVKQADYIGDGRKKK